MCWISWASLTQPKYAGGLGFIDIETFNDALLAKIGWRLLSDPNSLVAQVLLGKYARFSSFMECSAPSNASHGWRSVLAGREILRKCLGWVIGSGDQVRVWQDPWLSCTTPMTPIGPPSAKISTFELVTCSVHYLIDGTETKSCFISLSMRHSSFV